MSSLITIPTIAKLHQLLGLPSPSHPLISVFNFDDIQIEPDSTLNAMVTDFYIIALKKDCAGGIFRYGQSEYEYNEGVMYFTAPKQILQFNNILLEKVRGFVLAIHPDFLYSYQLSSKIKDFNYFSYSSNEALFIFEKEEKSILGIIENIAKEINSNLDSFTQDLLISNIELILKYCDRFYNRQFLTRKKENFELLTKFEEILEESFKEEMLLSHGIPTVKSISTKLNITANYLSDMLRVQTGLTTQQYIQNKLLDKAKILLSTTNLSVSEIAYQLGFEHAQSFHRLFRKQNDISPLEFRNSFN